MGKIWRIALQSQGPDGRLFVNTLHYITDLEAGEEEPSGSNVVDAVSDHLTTAYRAVLPSTYTLSSLEAREMVTPGSGDVPGSGSKVINLAGTYTAADALMAPGVTYLIKLRTDAALRSGRGHIALPSPRSSAVVTGNQFLLKSGTYWTNIGAFAALLDDSFDTGGIGAVTLHPVVYSRARHARGVSPWHFQIVEAIPNDVPHWLRSRMTVP